MQEDENAPDERRALFDEFVNQVILNANPETYFDELDLAEIFDYASDLDRLAVKMEVLLYAARHYPGSEIMQTRRAMLYSSLGEVEAAREVNSRVGTKDVLNRLLELRTEGTDFPDSKTLRHKLTAIINDADELEDEDLIQLVDLCADADELDFLPVLRPAIMERSSYPQTFLYQWADAAEAAENYDTAIPLFEELTMMEPFTLDFWLRLATAQGNGERNEAAMQSADMALAIAPDSVAAKRIKAFALYNLRRDLDEVVALLTQVVASDESFETDICILANALMLLDRHDRAREALAAYLADHPDARAAIETLIEVSPQTAVPFLRKYINEGLALTAEENGKDGAVGFPIIEWVRTLLSERRYKTAMVVVNTHSLDHPFYVWGGLIFELNYAVFNYPYVIDLFEGSVYNRLEEPYETHDPSVVLPYLMSLVREARASHALSQARRLLDNFNENFDRLNDARLLPVVTLLPSTRRTILDGYVKALHDIIDGIEKGADPDSFDPVGRVM